MKSPPVKSQGRKDPVRVSNHALFRWIERSGLVDVEALRMALSAALDRGYQAAAAMQQGEILILSAGLVYVIRDGTVITVLAEDGRHNHARQFSKRVGDAD